MKISKPIGVAGIVMAAAAVAVAAGIAGWLIGRDDSDSRSGSSERPSLISIAFGPEQVWKPTEEASKALFDCAPANADHTECVWRVMQAHGGSKDAFEFFKYAGAFLIDLQGNSRVKVGRVLYRWRVNENEAYVLLGGNPPLMSTEHLTTTPPFYEITGQAPAFDLQSKPEFQSLRARYPAASFWGAGATLESTKVLPDGSQSFIFRYRIVDGCSGCQTVGYVLGEYVFLPNGRLQTGWEQTTTRYVGMMAP